MENLNRFNVKNVDLNQQILSFLFPNREITSYLFEHKNYNFLLCLNHDDNLSTCYYIYQSNGEYKKRLISQSNLHSLKFLDQPIENEDSSCHSINVHTAAWMIMTDQIEISNGYDFKLQLGDINMALNPSYSSLIGLFKLYNDAETAFLLCCQHMKIDKEVILNFVTNRATANTNLFRLYCCLENHLRQNNQPMIKLIRCAIIKSKKHLILFNRYYSNMDCAIIVAPSNEKEKDVVIFKDTKIILNSVNDEIPLLNKKVRKNIKELASLVLPPIENKLELTLETYLDMAKKNLAKEIVQKEEKEKDRVKFEYESEAPRFTRKITYSELFSSNRKTKVKEEKVFDEEQLMILGDILIKNGLCDRKLNPNFGQFNTKDYNYWFKDKVKFNSEEVNTIYLSMSDYFTYRNKVLKLKVAKSTESWKIVSTEKHNVIDVVNISDPKWVSPRIYNKFDVLLDEGNYDHSNPGPYCYSTSLCKTHEYYNKRRNINVNWVKSVCKTVNLVKVKVEKRRAIKVKLQKKKNDYLSKKIIVTENFDDDDLLINKLLLKYEWKSNLPLTGHREFSKGKHVKFYTCKKYYFDVKMITVNDPHPSLGTMINITTKVAELIH
jgi:hypothetical protein